MRFRLTVTDSDWVSDTKMDDLELLFRNFADFEGKNGYTNEDRLKSYYVYFLDVWLVGVNFCHAILAGIYLFYSACL